MCIHWLSSVIATKPLNNANYFFNKQLAENSSVTPTGVPQPNNSDYNLYITFAIMHSYDSITNYIIYINDIYN